MHSLSIYARTFATPSWAPKRHDGEREIEIVKETDSPTLDTTARISNTLLTIIIFPPGWRMAAGEGIHNRDADSWRTMSDRSAGDVTLSSSFARLSHFCTPERTELARFFFRREIQTRSRIRTVRSVRTLPIYFSFFFFFCETRRTRCAYESRSAAPLLKEPRMRHEHSQNICYGHEERKVTASITQARRARYLLSSWHNHLSSWARQQRRESWCRTTTAYRPLPRSNVHDHQEWSGGLVGWTLEIRLPGVFFSPLSPLRRALLTLKPLSIFPSLKRGLLLSRWDSLALIV